MLATRDPLTGLLSEPVLLEALLHELDGTPRYGGPSLVVVDIVDHDRWADSCGALRADLVRRALGAMLRSSSRRSDVLGVLGPGRLCLLLPRTDVVQGRIVAGRVRAHCARLSGGGVVLAVGLVHVPEAVQPGALLARVDEVMGGAATASPGLRVVEP